MKKPHRDKETDALHRGFGRALRAAREAARLTQTQLAERIGRDQSSVSNAESGVHLPRAEDWQKLSVALKVPIWQLFKEAEGSRGETGAGCDMRKIAALNSQESVLVQIHRELSDKGRLELLDQAQACHRLYPRGSNVVAIPMRGRRQSQGNSR